MIKMKAKLYCIAFGCRNNNKDPNLTFFSLPKETDRRQKWFTLINREDLSKRENLKRTSHVVCSAHFEDSSVKIIKHLKENALPSLFLHNQPQEGSSCSEAQSITARVKGVSNDDSPLSENEIKVFCPKCDTEVSHTAAGIQEDQTKILIAKVYHYFEQEYEELKTIYGDLDLTPLSKFRQRTALATGVSETTVLQILKEEEGRNADKTQEPPEERHRAPKRSRQTESSSEEDSSGDNEDDNEQPSISYEAETLEVKIEPPECYNEEPEIYILPVVKAEPGDIESNKERAQTDPISIDVKTEPQDDVVDNANETLALNEPADTKRKGRKISRRSDVTSTRQHTQGESSTTATSSRGRVTEELHESSLFGDTEIKAEEIEIHEPGVS